MSAISVAYNGDSYCELIELSILSHEGLLYDPSMLVDDEYLSFFNALYLFTEVQINYAYLDTDSSEIS